MQLPTLEGKRFGEYSFRARCRESFFLVDSVLKEEAIILMAVGAYGLYRTVNTLRHAHTPLEPLRLVMVIHQAGGRAFQSEDIVKA